MESAADRRRSFLAVLRLTPFSAPIVYFAAAIVCGGLALVSPACQADGESITWIDAFFVSGSAVCVTGLSTIDVSRVFNPTGWLVLIVLMQLGGLGVMTYSCLLFHLWRARVSLTDRAAVAQSLLHDPAFSLGQFLKLVVAIAVGLELCGAVVLYWSDPKLFHPISAVFHAVSAFTNSGFSLFTDGLVVIKSSVAANLVVMSLIVLGGIGFVVLGEVYTNIKNRLTRRQIPWLMSWPSRMVLTTSAGLIVLGAGVIFLSAGAKWLGEMSWPEAVMAAFFQSITARTAGFNTVDIGSLSIVSLMALMALMFIGGSPGSCAGGIKTTTFRTLAGFIRSNLLGRRQTIIAGKAVRPDAVADAFTLLIFAAFIIGSAAAALSITESWGQPHTTAREGFMDLLFETVSAFGTVGLSTGATPTLSWPGKLIVIGLMFIGRLGPLLLLAALQEWRRPVRYDLPEYTLPIG